jgi:hypothetical protein
MSSIQKKIRDLTRLVKKQEKNGSKPSAEVLLKIEELTKNHANNLSAAKEKKFADKYHMVKFFERKKIVRRVIALDAKLQTDLTTKETKSVSEERERLIQDLTYVLYYPRDMKYIALLPGKNYNGSKPADIDEKSKHIADKARALAIERRQEDLDAGNQDKVEHAIAVGKGEASAAADKSSGGQSKKANKRKHDEEDDNNDTIVDNDDLDLSNREINKQLKANKKQKQKQRSEGAHDATDAQAKADTYAGTGARSAKGSPAGPGESATAPPGSAEDGKGGQEDDAADMDDFFLEEGGHADSVNAHHNPKHRNQDAIAIGNIKSFRNKNSNKSRPVHIPDDGSLTKQELRLRKWQAKVRMNNKLR